MHKLMCVAAEECWVRPNEFIPERWYSRPELIKNKNAFVPFSIGKAESHLSCNHSRRIFGCLLLV